MEAHIYSSNDRIQRRSHAYHRTHGANTMQVWMCLLEPSLPAGCGGGNTGVYGDPLPGRGLACYVYNEPEQRFVFWGPNSLLSLVDPALVPAAS
jgi:hypothetical protein